MWTTFATPTLVPPDTGSLMHPSTLAATPPLNPNNRFANLKTMWGAVETGDGRSAAQYESHLTSEQLRIQLLQQAAQNALDHVDGYLDIATDSE